jgi:hypothetical protein
MVRKGLCPGRLRRNGRRYYYRARREGGRVVKEYLGGGGAGLLAAFRNAAISLLRLHGIQEIAHALRDFAYQLRFLGMMKN